MHWCAAAHTGTPTGARMPQPRQQIALRTGVRPNIRMGGEFESYLSPIDLDGAYQIRLAYSACIIGESELSAFVL